LIKLTFKELAQEIKGVLVNKTMGSHIFEGVSIDTRTIRESELFIAIKGDREDGHDYIEEALAKNSAGLMVQQEFAEKGGISRRIPVVTVADTHKSMMQLASTYRRKLKAKLVAVTGSNGKTTTKEFVYAFVSKAEKRTFRSPGNLNNLYGLPLAIFRAPVEARYGVFELGISVPGEMTGLTQILRPDLALLTNIGPTHLETLGSIEGVAEAKFELVDNSPIQMPVIINADDQYLVLAAKKRKRDVITYGVINRADFMAEPRGIDEGGRPIVLIEGHTIAIPLFGKHQIYNLLAGYTVCRTLGLVLSEDDIQNLKYSFEPYRGEIDNFEGITTISDCYNANPVSMESGLRSFAEYCSNTAMKDRRSVVVIGDMLELGRDSGLFHRRIGALLAEGDFDLTIAVGPESEETYRAATEKGLNKNKIVHFNDTNAAAEALLGYIERGDIIYFKASRGMALEKLVVSLKGTAFRQN